jgi:hypothetical protein
MKANHLSFEYKNPHNACHGVCGVSIFQTAPDMAIVVLTELPDNPGMSITNAFEHISTSVKDILLPGIAASQIIWVERYVKGTAGFDEHGPVDGETFDLVRLEAGPHGYGRPSWSPLGANRSQADFWKILFMSEWPLDEFPAFRVSSACR